MRMYTGELISGVNEILYINYLCYVRERREGLFWKGGQNKRVEAGTSTQAFL